MINKTPPSVDYSIGGKVMTLLISTNQDFIKVPQVFKLVKECLYKTLGTSITYSPI